MIIRENPKSKTFERLWNGDVFISKGGLFMRVAPPNEKYNAVNLATGDMKFFNDTDSVLFVYNATLTYDA